jgi:hypothetical protein
MPQRTFGDGYLAGWRWVRGDDQVPIAPAYSVSEGPVSEGSVCEGEAPYLAGVVNGLRDGCLSRLEPVATNSEQIENWFDRGLHRGVSPSDSVRPGRSPRYTLIERSGIA